jgi:hypothetical protein
MSVKAPFRERFRTKKVQKFLYELYELSKHDPRGRERVFQSATTENIDILIRVLRLVLTREIPIKKTVHYEAIKRSHKMPHLVEHFLREETYAALKANTTDKKKLVLRKISTYHELLFALFN